MIDFDEWKDFGKPHILEDFTCKKPVRRVYIYFGRCNNKPNRSREIIEELIANNVEIIPLSKIKR